MNKDHVDAIIAMVNSELKVEVSSGERISQGALRSRGRAEGGGARLALLASWIQQQVGVPRAEVGGSAEGDA